MKMMSAASQRPEDEKLRAADLLLVVAEVGSALAMCGLLHWAAA